jgi:hypothetical protein
MATQLEKTAIPTAAAGRRALMHLFGEFERARSERDAATARLNRFAETIQLILAGLPDYERAELGRKFEELRSGNQGRGGEVFNNVVALFRRDNRPEWKIHEIQDALEISGLSIDPKALSNALVYLSNTGRLRRISRGNYIVTDIGVGIEMEGKEDGTSRVTEHDF